MQCLCVWCGVLHLFLRLHIQPRSAHYFADILLNFDTSRAVSKRFPPRVSATHQQGNAVFRFFRPANRFTGSSMTPCQVQVARLLSRSESCFRITGSIILARLDKFYLAHLASTFQRPPGGIPGSEHGARRSLPKSQWDSSLARPAVLAWKCSYPQ